MRGKLLTFETGADTGLISGDDGQRYHFERAEVEGGLYALLPGRDVDFLPAGDGGAHSVYGIPTIGVAGEKNRFIAALLALFLGWFGIHKFYLGKNRAGWIMLLCGTIGWLAVVPGVAIAVISLSEFVIYLIKDDPKFYDDYVVGHREWF
jgi:TM2 domain-containing membrane protein YozV